MPIGKLLPPPASSSGARRSFGKLIAKVIGSAAALIVAAGIASAWIYGHDRPAPVDSPKVHPPAPHHSAKHGARNSSP